MDECTCAVCVKVIFFAKARELTGVRQSEILVAPDISCDKLKDKIVQEFKLDIIRNSLILAINEQYVESDTIIHFNDQDEVAVIPPISGGMF